MCHFGHTGIPGHFSSEKKSKGVLKLRRRADDNLLYFIYKHIKQSTCYLDFAYLE